MVLLTATRRGCSKHEHIKMCAMLCVGSTYHGILLSAELLLPCHLESCCGIDTCRCVFSCCLAAFTRLMTSFSATATPASGLVAMQARVRAARLCMKNRWLVLLVSATGAAWRCQPRALQARKQVTCRWVSIVDSSQAC